MGKDIVLLKKNNEAPQKRTDNLEKDIENFTKLIIYIYILS